MTQSERLPWSRPDADPLADIAAIVATARPIGGPFTPHLPTAVPGFVVRLAGQEYAATRAESGPGWSLTPTLDVRKVV